MHNKALADELELLVGVAKMSKYAVSESGDTLEVTERPHGGLSLVLADGQQSGRAAKVISNLVARKAITLLAEGVRDGAAARAAHDYLRTYRQGKVSCELAIASLDLETMTLVISRNSHCPALILESSVLRVWDEPSEAIGIHERTKPVILELPLAANTWLVLLTDGILEAGEHNGAAFPLADWVRERMQSGPVSPADLADAILSQAVALDRGRPQDDMSVLVLALLPRVTDDPARRLTVRFPLPPY
jgi:serine phosphatase RsbU (regulator of sigma subunit)